jgi:uncharacterized protein YbbK (DUF523 family)
MVYKTSGNRVPLVAVSACLLGHAVRYDGTDKAHQLLAEIILPHIDVLPVCPEAGAGLGVPRPPVQLVQFDDGVHAMGRDDPQWDVTAQLIGFADAQADLFEKTPGLCAHIFKSRSPSCGLGSTPVHNTAGHPLYFGQGLYAAHIAKRLPWLLLVEDIAIDSPQACNDFLEKLFAAHAARSAITG